MEHITPEYVMQYLAASAGLNISPAEAMELVPLVRAQRAALARLHSVDVISLRTPIWFDPREGYGE